MIRDAPAGAGAVASPSRSIQAARQPAPSARDVLANRVPDVQPLPGGERMAPSIADLPADVLERRARRLRRTGLARRDDRGEQAGEAERVDQAVQPPVEVRQHGERHAPVVQRAHRSRSIRQHAPRGRLRIEREGRGEEAREVVTLRDIAHRLAERVCE